MQLIGSTGPCVATKQLSCAANTPSGQIKKLRIKFEASSSMPEPDLIELFVRPLSDLGIRYLVSGSVASMLYGEPRVTHDIDLVVFLRHNDIARLPTAFPRPEFYVPPPEVIEAETSRERGSFNIIHADSGLKADLYTAGRDEMDAWAFRRPTKYSIKGVTINLAPPEYVIVRKLEFYREGGSEKHVRDIRSMLAVSGDQIDKSELNEWIQRRGVQEQWQKIQS
jgi:hypothetical protein